MSTVLKLEVKLMAGQAHNADEAFRRVSEAYQRLRSRSKGPKQNFDKGSWKQSSAPFSQSGSLLLVFPSSASRAPKSRKWPYNLQSTSLSNSRFYTVIFPHFIGPFGMSKMVCPRLVASQYSRRIQPRPYSRKASEDPHVWQSKWAATIQLHK